jgi:hypothetical protein
LTSALIYRALIYRFFDPLQDTSTELTSLIAHVEVDPHAVAAAAAAANPVISAPQPPTPDGKGNSRRPVRRFSSILEFGGGGGEDEDDVDAAGSRRGSELTVLSQHVQTEFAASGGVMGAGGAGREVNPRFPVQNLDQLYAQVSLGVDRRGLLHACLSALGCGMVGAEYST